MYHRVDTQDTHTVRVKSDGEVVKTWTEISYVNITLETLGLTPGRLTATSWRSS